VIRRADQEAAGSTSDRAGWVSSGSGRVAVGAAAAIGTFDLAGRRVDREEDTRVTERPAVAIAGDAQAVDVSHVVHRGNLVLRCEHRDLHLRFGPAA